MSPQGILCVTLTLFGVFENIHAQTCAPTQCSSDYFDPDLDLSPVKVCYNDGETVSLSCIGDLGGPPFNNCVNGGWQYPSPTCEIFKCAKPNIGDALNVIPDQEEYIARDTITYTCNQGYTLTGATTATCDAENTWNPPTVPVCIASCASPNIPNGNLTTGGPFNHGDSAQVNCFEGSDLEDGASSTITCQVDGTWDTVPQCFSRCNITGVPNSNSESHTLISHDTTKTITCNNDYSYQQERSFTFTCNDGILGGEVPEQCYMDCTSLEAPVNGGLKGGNLHGESVVFSCDRGYGLNGTDTDTCTEGVWEKGGDEPTCDELSLTDSIKLYCNPDKFVVEIPGALLGSDVSISSVTLGSCEGSYYDGEYLYANSSYTECETTNEVDDLMEQIIYRNILTSASTSEVVTNQELLTINIACVFDQDNVVSSSAVVQNTLAEDLNEDGKFSMNFAAYEDDSHDNKITDDVIVNADDVIYILAEVEYVSRIDVFPTRCYATPEPEYSHFRFFDLIEGGCPVSSYASELRTDASTNQNFAFQMNVFRFTESNSDSIYIHCELKICPVDVEDGCPLPGTCPALRRKRSTQINFSKHVSAGPIRISHADTADETISSGAWQFTALTVYSATVSGILLSVMVIIGVVIYRRRSATTGYMRTGQI